MTRCALYHRVSTSDQNPAGARDELRAAARGRGFEVALDVDGDIILDGSHRLRAAKELWLADVPVRQVKLDGESQVEWMMKMAVLRRHLTKDQRAMMTAEYAKRHPEPTGRPGGSKKVPPHAGGTSSRPKTKAAKQPALAEAAQAHNVSVTGAAKAAALLAARPALFEKVHQGEMTLAQARREVAKRDVEKKSVELAARPVSQPKGRYQCIVVDPPWPLGKRAREARPAQAVHDCGAVVFGTDVVVPGGPCSRSENCDACEAEER